MPTPLVDAAAAGARGVGSFREFATLKRRRQAAEEAVRTVEEQSRPNIANESNQRSDSATRLAKDSSSGETSTASAAGFRRRTATTLWRIDAVLRSVGWQRLMLCCAVLEVANVLVSAAVVPSSPSPSRTKSYTAEWESVRDGMVIIAQWLPHVTQVLAAMSAVEMAWAATVLVLQRRLEAVQWIDSFVMLSLAALRVRSPSWYRSKSMVFPSAESGVYLIRNHSTAAMIIPDRALLPYVVKNKRTTG